MNHLVGQSGEHEGIRSGMKVPACTENMQQDRSQPSTEKTEGGGNNKKKSYRFLSLGILSGARSTGKKKKNRGLGLDGGSRKKKKHSLTVGKGGETWLGGTAEGERN